MSSSSGSQEYTQLPQSERKCSCGDEDSQIRRHNRVRPSLLQLCSLALVSALMGAAALALLRGIILDHPADEDPRQKKLDDLLHFPSEEVTFFPDERYGSIATPESNQAWDELLGPSRGFISLHEPQQYGLGLGRPVEGYPDRQVYGVSMFHQLHCLIMIRKTYYGLMEGHYNLTAFDLDQDEPNIPFEIKHNDHCFDFLQQSIRCAGLVQIELPHGKDRKVFDGYWSKHVCKSWDGIMDFMTKYQRST